MSWQVDQHIVQQYNANVIALVQQETSKFEGYFEKVGFTGKRFTVDRMGPTEVVQRVGRHADTQIISTPLDRRWGTCATYDWAELVDDVDKLKTLYDPTHPYAVNAGKAFNRKKDDIILAALLADVQYGEEGNSTLTWASQTDQIMTEGGTNGLTLTKLIDLKERIGLADFEDDVRWVLAVSPKQITNLFNTTEVKSADYNTVKALAQGSINSFMGFEFKRTTKCGKSGNMRRCIAFAEAALKIGSQQEPITTISQRADKNNATQIHIEMTMGGVRIEEKRVFEVQCYEA